MEQDPKNQKPGGGMPGPRTTRTHTYAAGGGGEDETAAARQALRRAKRRKQVLRNRIIGGVVLASILALLVFGIVQLVRYLGRDTGDTSETSLPESAASLPVSQPPEKVEPEPELPVVNPDDYNYYEEGTPLLLNRDNPLPEELQGDIDVVEIGLRLDTGEMHYLPPTVAAAYFAMVEAAAEDGITLYPVSGYRSHERQVSNYNTRVSEHLAQGYSREEAEALTETLYAVPGTSEHEAGLAIDINSLDQSFEYTREYEWLRANCARFGFILRYEKDTFDETGIDYEPWHYRYVGDNHSYAIEALGVTLEAYVAMLEDGSYLPGTIPPPAAASGSGSAASGTESGGAPAPGSGADSASASSAASGSVPMPLG